jgi:hypothetical protein
MSAWITWMTLCGRPAAEKVVMNLSAAEGVCGDGLMITELPARMAGTSELTTVR